MGRRLKRFCRELVRDQSGQATTEYAIVFLAFLAMVVALGLVWAAGHKGAFVDEAEEAASHRIVIGLPETAGTVQDVFMF